MSPTTVRVDRNGRGAWEVAMPDQHEPVTSETLDDARRVASLCAGHRRPCELIGNGAPRRGLGPTASEQDCDRRRLSPRGDAIRNELAMMPLPCDDRARRRPCILTTVPTDVGVGRGEDRKPRAPRPIAGLGVCAARTSSTSFLGGSRRASLSSALSCVSRADGVGTALRPDRRRRSGLDACANPGAKALWRVDPERLSDHRAGSQRLARRAGPRAAR